MTFEVRPGAREPEYGLHCREEFFMKSKKWVLLAGIVALFVYLFVSNGIYRHVSTVLLTLLDLAGLYATYLLVRKSLNIHDKSADRVCKVLQEGGCDHVLELKASKFFGLFGWSEVGFAYFTVSLGCLLISHSGPTIWRCATCCACRSPSGQSGIRSSAQRHGVRCV